MSNPTEDIEAYRRTKAFEERLLKAMQRNNVTIELANGGINIVTPRSSRTPADKYRRFMSLTNLANPK